MEDPDELLRRILAWAETDSRVEAVIETGSRARRQRVDALSDLDIELIGAHPSELADDDSWIQELGNVMVTLALANDSPGDLGWPTRLVVFEQGRKVDFTLAGWQRIDDMKRDGLDALYNHGYVVHLDKTERLSQLPAPLVAPPTRQPPTQAEFASVESEYWFEATQVAVYLARQDLWVVKFRENTMHSCLLKMLEWFVQATGTHTWHLGHHMSEWLPEREFALAQRVFTHFDVDDTVRGLNASMTLFETVSRQTATSFGLDARSDLPSMVRRHLSRLTGQDFSPVNTE
jgi:aminoglycoside 6-adenylyltransferase